jgi:hypothetical protein
MSVERKIGLREVAIKLKHTLFANALPKRCNTLKGCRSFLPINLLTDQPEIRSDVRVLYFTRR